MNETYDAGNHEVTGYENYEKSAFGGVGWASCITIDGPGHGTYIAVLDTATRTHMTSGHLRE